jgi:hypothetical protein
VMSTHLPPVHGQIDALCQRLARVPDAAPFVGPDQQALEAILQSAHGPAAGPAAGV